jgi:hypothetical protein
MGNIQWNATQQWGTGDTQCWAQDSRCCGAVIRDSRAAGVRGAVVRWRARLGGRWTGGGATSKGNAKSRDMYRRRDGVLERVPSPPRQRRAGTVPASSLGEVMAVGVGTLSSS